VVSVLVPLWLLLLLHLQLLLSDTTVDTITDIAIVILKTFYVINDIAFVILTTFDAIVDIAITFAINIFTKIANAAKTIFYCFQFHSIFDIIILTASSFTSAVITATTLNTIHGIAISIETVANIVTNTTTATATTIKTLILQLLILILVQILILTKILLFL
jgi:hypothetical protein